MCLVSHVLVTMITRRVNYKLIYDTILHNNNLKGIRVHIAIQCRATSQLQQVGPQQEQLFTFRAVAYQLTRSNNAQ